MRPSRTQRLRRSFRSGFVEERKSADTADMSQSRISSALMNFMHRNFNLPVQGASVQLRRTEATLRH
jgi:hypothetical protein